MKATVMPLANLAPPADAAPVVDIEGLWTVFGRGESEVVIHRDLALQVRRGEVLTLVGGSGTGKTVLLRQMLGLEHPARGRVQVLGQPAAELAAPAPPAPMASSFRKGPCFRPSAC